MNNVPGFDFVVTPEVLGNPSRILMSSDRYVDADYMYELLTGIGLILDKDFEISSFMLITRDKNREIAKIVTLLNQEAFTIAKVVLG